MASKPMTDPMELVGRLEEWAKEIALDGTPSQIGPSSSDLTEAAACIREMVEWWPIETAPRDGTRVLLFSVPNEVPSLRPHIADGYWKASTGIMAPGFWVLGQSVGPSFCPTHWLPLPPAPGAEA